jgi:hypothetical protein
MAVLEIGRRSGQRLLFLFSDSLQMGHFVKSSPWQKLAEISSPWFLFRVFGRLCLRSRIQSAMQSTMPSFTAAHMML